MKSSSPKVSIIIPNYNHSAYLTERIDSVLNQTYQDFEVLILDDCSTDSSKSVIDSYKRHPKVSHVIYNEVNSGSTFRQWEKGIGLARGEYIWFAESDDWCEDNMLEHLVEGIESDPDCCISYCQSYCVEGVNKLRFTSDHRYLSELMHGADYIHEYLILRVGIFNASMAIWRKSCYVKISKDHLSYKLCGDWRFWLEIANCGKVHISGRVLNYFRKHEEDVSGKMYKSGLNYLEELRVFHAIYEFRFARGEQYLKGIKQVFKRYYKERHLLAAEVRAEIESRFDQIGYRNIKEYQYLLFNRYRYKLKYIIGTK